MRRFTILLSFYALMFASKAVRAEATLVEYWSPMHPQGVVRAISPDGVYVVLGDDSRFVIVNLKTQRAERALHVLSPVTRTYSHTGKSREVGASALPVIFSPSSKLLLIGHLDGFLEKYDVVTGAVSSRQVASGPIGTLAVVQPAGRDPLVLVGSAGATGIWNLNSLALTHSFKGLSVGEEEETVIRLGSSSSFHPDGNWAVVGDDDGVRILDLASGAEEGPYDFRPSGQKFFSLMQVGFGSHPRELSVVVSEDESFIVWHRRNLATGGGDVLARLPLAEFRKDNTAMTADGSILISPGVTDLYRFAWGKKASCARFISAAPTASLGTELLLERPHPYRSSLAITPDGKTAVIASPRPFDHNLQVWSLP